MSSTNDELSKLLIHDDGLKARSASVSGIPLQRDPALVALQAETMYNSRRRFLSGPMWMMLIMVASGLTAYLVSAKDSILPAIGLAHPVL